MTSGDNNGPNASGPFAVSLTVANVTRTLLASGYVIREFDRFHGYVEFDCEREDRFGALIPYRFVICDSDSPPPAVLRPSESDRTIVIVAREGGPGYLSWDRFALLLGGAVPSWRALSGDYADALRTAGRNIAPPGWSGEGWVAFEAATADGLEFVFGRAVQRFGNKLRGEPLPDLLALTPDNRLLVIDAKASGSPYLLKRPNLRPLGEYVGRQKSRQRSGIQVGGAVVVAGDFANDTRTAREICDDFNADHQIPLTLLPVSTLLNMVDSLRSAPHVRPAIRWSRLFGKGGVLGESTFQEELKAATTESWGTEP